MQTRRLLNPIYSRQGHHSHLVRKLQGADAIFSMDSSSTAVAATHVALLLIGAAIKPVEVDGCDDIDRAITSAFEPAPEHAEVVLRCSLRPFSSRVSKQCYASLRIDANTQLGFGLMVVHGHIHGVLHHHGNRLLDANLHRASPSSLGQTEENQASF